MADFAFLSLRAQSLFSTSVMPQPRTPANPQPPASLPAATPPPDSAETTAGEDSASPEDRKLRILLKAIQQLYTSSGKSFDADAAYARIRKSEQLSQAQGSTITMPSPPPASQASAQHLDGSLTSVDGQAAAAGQDPLILDLAGDGVALSRADDGALFDIRGNGTREQTAWTVGADDALLALDRNGDGVIDNGGELFGDQHGAPHGFAELARFDTNHDSVIDAGDPIYSRLRLWLDRNRDGFGSADELTTLLEQGIAALQLRSRDASYTDVAGNLIMQTGSYTRTDGSQGGIIDARLDVRG